MKILGSPFDIRAKQYVISYEITKFFHANATIKYRKNLISHLISDDSILATSHKDK